MARTKYRVGTTKDDIAEYKAAKKALSVLYGLALSDEELLTSINYVDDCLLSEHPGRPLDED